MQESIFTPLKEKGLTSLMIQYNWKADTIRLSAAKEWEPDIDFSKYNNEFLVETILTDDVIYLNTKQVWTMYKEFGLKEHFDKVIDMVKEGKHSAIEIYYYDKYDMRFLYNQHNRKMGIHNKRRGMFTGGVRRHELDEPELEVIQDGLNLGRSMSFKNVPAGVPYGGAKQVLQSGPVDINNLEQLGFLAYVVDKARGMSTPDMKMPGDMVGIIIDKFSKQWLAGTNSIFGASGIPTAAGVVEAMKEAVKFKLEKDSLSGVSIALQGMGSVGGNIASLLVKENAKLVVADLYRSTAEKFKADNPSADITVVEADEIIDVETEVFCPCAAGGVISEENIPKLKFKIIIGGANNQLKATSQEGEIKLAQMLEARGILYQIDWWHNCGGVIGAIEEYEKGEDTTLEEILEKVRKRVASQTVRKLKEAKEKGISPTEAIFIECNEVVYGDRPIQ